MPDYKRTERPPLDSQIEHIAVTFVLDVSGSMNEMTSQGKSSIQLLNNGLNDLIEALGNSVKHKNIVDLSIIAFGEPGKEEVYQPFAPVCQIGTPISLVANHSSTYASKALDMAIENTRERVKAYRGGMWKPWVVFMTDGHLHDDISEVAARSRQREAEGKLRTFAIGIGDDFDGAQLKLLTDKAYALAGYKVEEFLSWVGNSIGVVSESAANAQVELPSNQDPNNPGQVIFSPVI